MRPPALGLVAIVALGAAACTSILGYGDIEVRDDGGTTSSAGGGSIGGTGGSGATGGSVATGGTGGGTGGGASACGEGWDCHPVSANASLILVPAGGSCPSGWQLSARLYTGDGDGCETCTCAPSTGTCSHANVDRYADTNCTNAKDSQAAVSDGSCVDVYELNSVNQADSYFVTVDPTSESCAPSEGTAQTLDRIPLCEPSGIPPGSCPGAERCVPSVPSEEGRVCELYEGDVDCPDGYSYKRLVYMDAVDTRNCQCLCGAVSNGSCSGAGVQLNEDSDCQGASLTFVPAGDCRSVSSYSTHDGYTLDAGTYVAGDCTPQSLSGGSVTFGQPVSICCAQ